MSEVMLKHPRLPTALSVFGSLAHSQADLSIDPATLTVSSGETFNVDVDVSNVSDLYGYQFDDQNVHIVGRC